MGEGGLLGVPGAILVFALGACVGSFAGVVAYRLPRELSIVAPRSFCARCREPLALWANLPLISYIVLRGRCPRCGGEIGFRYFLIEAALASAAIYLYLQFPPADALSRFVLCASLLVIGMIDFDWGVIYDGAALTMVPLGFVAAWLLMPEVGWRSSLIGIIGGITFLFVTRFGYWLIRRKEGVGVGDFYVVAIAGAFLGWPGAFFTLFFGSLFGSIGGLAIAINGWTLPEEPLSEAIAEVTAARSADSPTDETSVLQRPIPFGPFLALAAAVYALFQTPLTRWYLAS
ncbi:MAG TPA: prepilin peptidase [Candidatus Binataceae bacterium]|nr:prepilin peptidase [Candidatus Binataceae bacterium]